jgi:hypothetical protein
VSTATLRVDGGLHAVSAAGQLTVEVAGGVEDAAVWAELGPGGVEQVVDGSVGGRAVIERHVVERVARNPREVRGRCRCARAAVESAAGQECVACADSVHYASGITVDLTLAGFR